jgi:hypothetical protein
MGEPLTIKVDFVPATPGDRDADVSDPAESMLRALSHELLSRIPEFKAGEPELLGTNFMRGVERMPFRFTPEK